MSKKKNHIKNLTLAAMFLALGLILPFLNWPDPTDWNYAFPNAFTGSVMRSDLWMEIWIDGGDSDPINSKCDIWNASTVSNCDCHGF